MTTLERAERGLVSLNAWVRKNGWAGYDPYDIKGVPPLIWMQKYGLLRKGLNVLVEFWPTTVRKLFRVKPARNAKAMALFARAYLNLYQYNADEHFLKAAQECLLWLIDNICTGYSGPCWGYPFDWQAKIFIPKGTPSGVVTSMAAAAFLEAYSLIREESYLEVAKGCCEFFNNDLHWDQITPQTGCYSYTPIDSFHVHNANLWVAATIYRLSAFLSDDHALARAGQALKYTLEDQHSNGSWTYYGPPNQVPGVVDNYHTGFVLRALLDIYDVDPQLEIKSALRTGLSFYQKELFIREQIPKRTARRKYPIDIHSCSEAILCFSTLSALFPESLDLARKVLDWTLTNMQDAKGFFFYRKHKVFTSRMGFIRWGQAWMLFALSEYLLKASAELTENGRRSERD